MLYAWLKIIHIISASILFGTGLGTAFYMWYVNQKSDIQLIAQATRQVVIADWLFTSTSALVQAITGFAMVLYHGYSLYSLWVLGSIVGYSIAGICWLPVVWLQMRCRDLADESLHNHQPLSTEYQRYFKFWWLLGIPAFLALVGVFFLMSSQLEW